MRINNETDPTTVEALAGAHNLHRAWLQVRQNRGAPGIDGVTVQTFESKLPHHLTVITKNLLSSHYRPSPLRAVDIPKPDHHGIRTLGIPTVQDRLVLQAITQILTPLWEPHFSPFSFAYRVGRTALDAVLLTQQRLQSGQHWIVDLDIEKFFDQVDHVRLMQRLTLRIEDAALLDLIADFLRAGLMRVGTLQPTRIGIPQGSPLSPLLANIVLDELDQEYASHGWSFVRYADDCILLAKSQAEAGALLEFTREFLADRLHLRLNPTKTRIVQPTEVGFLGFTYRLSRYGKVTRSVTRNALANFRARVTELVSEHRNQPLEHTFEAVATFFRGWTTYYSFTQDDTLQAARTFACDLLRSTAWSHWRTPQEKLRQLCNCGVPEDAARKAAFALDFPDADDDPPVLRQILPDPFFERYGLRIQRLKPQSQSKPAKSPAVPLPPPNSEERVRKLVFAFIARRLRIRR